MNILSIKAMAFVFLAIAIYFNLPKKFKPTYLLILSLGLYTYANPKNLIFLIFSSFTVYLGGVIFNYLDTKNQKKIEEQPELKKTLNKENKRNKKWILILLMVLNFGILFYFKYINTLLVALNKFIFSEQVDFFDIALPLGISFYTFQAIGYLIDVYRNKYPNEKNYLNLLLFLSYFPQVIQGPIGRYDHLMPQLLVDHSFDMERLKSGALTMLWGYFKKLTIAEGLAILVNEILGSPVMYSGSYIVVGVFLYSIQIYCDFSGGIDIISGISEIIGVQLDKNFRRPFFATSLGDFWRRWHITLGSWMRDYVFYSVAFSPKITKFNKWLKRFKNRRLSKILPSAIASMIVFFFVGIWHGASFKYIAFGLFNGTIITASLLLEERYEKIKNYLGINSEGIGWRIFQVMRTLLLCTIGRYFTRALSFMQALQWYKLSFKRFNPYILINGDLAEINLNFQQLNVIFIAIIILFGIELLVESGKDVKGIILNSHFVFRAFVVIALILFTITFGYYGEFVDSSNFIYQGF